MNEFFKRRRSYVWFKPRYCNWCGIRIWVDTYFIMYADGTMREVEVDDKSLKKIEPVIIHSEFNQILLKLWEKDKNSHCIDYF